MTTATILAIAVTAEAQSRRPAREPRAFMAVSGGWQGGTASADGVIEFERYAETGTVRTQYPSAGAGLFDLSAGIRLTRRLGAGAAFTFTAGSSDGGVTAAIPHPLLLDRHRQVSGEATGLSRQEMAIHPFVSWDARSSGSWRLRIFAGPSFITVRRDVVEGVDVTESYPYDTAVFSRAASNRASGSGFGGQAGIDVWRMLSRQIGAGVLVRYAVADVDVNTSAGMRVSSDGGGVQVGGGVRVLLGR